MTTLNPKYKHKPSKKHTLEEVLKSLQDLIRHDLIEDKSAASGLGSPPADPSGNDSEPRGQDEQKIHHEQTAPMHEDFAPVTPDSGPVNLGAVMQSLQDLITNELDIGEAPRPQPIEMTAPAAVPASPEPPPMEADISTELISLDEALTLDESMPMAPASPASATPDTLEFPGEISLELLSEPETPPPNFEPEPSIQNIPPPAEAENPPALSPEVQQPLILDEAPVLLAQKPEPSTQNTPPLPALEPDATPVAAEISFADITLDAAPAENSGSISEESLPAIEVEESFDENDYLDAIAKQNPTPPPETHAAVPASNEVAASEPAAPQKKIALEIVDEPLLEKSSRPAAVDFDSVDFKVANNEPASVTEITAAENKPPQATAEITKFSGITPTALTAAEEPPMAPHQVEINTETTTTPAPILDTPAAASPDAPAAKTKSSVNEDQHSFKLDDIPVLKEVVATPAGSSLAPRKPSASVKKQPSPGSDRARDIVVRAVAKLNIEMRKSGGIGLDTKIILRLQQLIRTELEKDDKK